MNYIIVLLLVVLCLLLIAVGVAVDKVLVELKLIRRTLSEIADRDGWGHK